MFTYIIPMIVYGLTLYGLYSSTSEQIDSLTFLFALIGIPVILFVSKLIIEKVFGNLSEGLSFIAAFASIYFFFV
ncbi:MAG: hypothetical protein HQL46_05510 [Gammaproteobacteria bacterium]|nr:hypothetical protein [Gammaproteobacteria bacterium]